MLNGVINVLINNDVLVCFLCLYVKKIGSILNFEYCYTNSKLYVVCTLIWPRIKIASIFQNKKVKEFLRKYSF